MTGGRAYTCPHCGRVSHHPEDVRARFCVACGQWGEAHPQPEQRCPHCLYRMDSATGMSGTGPPEEGDFSMCLNCGAVLAFGPGLLLRSLRSGELEGVPPDLLRELGRLRRAHGRVKPLMGDLRERQRGRKDADGTAVDDRAG